MSQHHFHPTVLREYDIRGIIGETLDEKDAYAIGQALGTLIRAEDGKSASVGYDGRHSSPGLAQAVSEGLASTGLKVIQIGLGPTPMLYYSVYALETDGAVMVTGSHNPPNYNGFKMMVGKKPCFGPDIKKIGMIAAEGAYAAGEGSIEQRALFDAYIERLLKDFDGQSMNVAWDAGNGAAGPAVTALTAKLPGRHHVIYGEVDGDFPNHHPDPTEEKNLVDLQKLVIEQGFDLGLAFDGDGDRLGAVDGQGRVVWGDQLLSILAEDVLSDLPGATIIADVKASQALFDHVAEKGGKPLMWRTGHSLIKSKMAETGAPLAGEMSGHIFFAHKYYGFDDALYAAVRLLGALSRQGGSLTKLKDAMPKLVNTPELRFPCPEERKFEVVKEIVARLRTEGAEFSDIDGARVNTPDGWWLLRASNTQDVLVARCEAKNEAALNRLKAALAAALAASGVTPPDDL